MIQPLVTLLIGVVVFIIGQIIQRYILDPLLNYKKARAAVLKHIIMSAHLITLTGQLDGDTFENYIKGSRDVGGDIISAALSIPFYNMLHRRFKYPSIEEVVKIYSDLIDILNSLSKNSSVEHYYYEQRLEALSSITSTLNLPIDYTDLKLIASGTYRNGKNLEEVLKGVEKAYK